MNYIDVFNAVSITKCSDIKGLLELFEASYLAFEGETILDEAKAFSMEALRNIYPTLNLNLTKEVAHALELPMHWRVQWFEVKWRITMYETYNKNIDKHFFELAKLNFNTVQAILQKDLREISRWWRNIRIMEGLNFTRDRLAESFLCSVGFTYEPQYSCFRKCLARITTMILIIDDVYGSIEELEQFTEAIDNGIQTKLRIYPSWTGYCKALFVESKWYNKGYSPSLEEYLSNALISSGAIVISIHLMLSVGSTDGKIINLLGKDEDLVYNISIITQLYNDLGTSMVTTNIARMVQCLYQFGDGFDIQDRKTRNHIISLLIEPFNLDKTANY
ncbi:nerol synthase [Gossypium australe]|uniref:Nerol synthase n=1 Tax=Gossypium australe TaxID=47621 RepID=A0A5B6WC11_9ROSI|nr:nerol synthase [Gossypium australe]